MSVGPAYTDRFAGRLLRIGSGFLLVVVIGFGLMQFSVIRLPWSNATYDVSPLGDVPDFVLTERRGRQVRKADLLGKVWVVNFMFTRCTDECPLETSRMAYLQSKFAQHKDVRWVSISVDPEHDTPTVLTHYAQQFGADVDRWWFLTGAKTMIYRLATEGFHLGVMVPEPASSTSRRMVFPIGYVVRVNLDLWTPAVAWAHHPTYTPPASAPVILHSARFVLVDRRARIRGYYDSREEKAMRRLQDDVMLLLHEPAS
jgi:protein SCO1/2